MVAIPTMMKGTTKKKAATPSDYVGHSRAYSEAASRAALIFPANTLSLLKKVAGRQTTVLTHYSRTTGNFHETTIWFVLDADKLYIGTANVNRQWVRNVQKTPKIRLTRRRDIPWHGSLPDRAQRAPTRYGRDSP